MRAKLSNTSDKSVLAPVPCPIDTGNETDPGLDVVPTEESGLVHGGSVSDGLQSCHGDVQLTGGVGGLCCNGGVGWAGGGCQEEGRRSGGEDGAELGVAGGGVGVAGGERLSAEAGGGWGKEDVGGVTNRSCGPVRLGVRN